MKSYKGSSLFVVFTGIIIAIGRLYLSIFNASNDAVLIVMAIVNFVAFGFVILFLISDIDEYCYEKINESGIETSLKNKGKQILSIIRFILLLVYLIWGICYVSKFRKEYYNDMLSIIALTISIANNGLTCELGAFYYKIIIKLSKKLSGG